MLSFMIIYLITILSLSTLSLAALTVDTARSSDLPHPIGTFYYNGTLGGHDVYLNGTAQEIIAQFQDLHPEFTLPEPKATRDIPADEIHAFTTRQNGAPLCLPIAEWGWLWAQGPATYKNVDFLSSLSFGCGVPARTCVRIACQQQSAIYLCNDNYYGLNLSCLALASNADNVCQKCGFTLGNEWFCGGQEFNGGNFNVIVRWDGDNCGSFF
jgi:hypothetical protein